MVKNFISTSSGWDYANLAKTAASHGGPKKLVDKIYKAGQVEGIIIATVVIFGGIATYKGVTWLSSKIKTKFEERILQQEIKIDENSDVE